ncbi:hypothetical protein GCM10028791_11170 [Echinicola sediminis]
MKSPLLLSTIVMAFCLGSFEAEAQFIKKLKKAAEQGVQNAVERRVSQEVENAAQRQTDKYLEQVFGPPSEYEGGGGYDYGKIMGSANFNVDTEESYHFKGYTDMEITGTDEKGKAIDPVIVKSLLSEQADCWAMELESNDKDVKETVMIFDQKNQATILLMESDKGEKSSMAYGIDWNKMMDNAAENQIETAEESDFSVQKTGNTKTILGYPCEEYRSENEEFEANYWVSTSPINGYTSFWSKQNSMMSKNTRMKYNTYMEKFPDGDIMEMNYRSKEDKSTSHMKIVEINDSQKFDYEMAAYTNIMEGKE